MAKNVYLGIDIGASSGRVIAGLLNGKTIELQEVYRFPNGAVSVGGGLYWNILGLWSSMLDGLRASAQAFGTQVVSVGVDTWGVDFAFLGRNGTLLGNPFCYRDPRTNGMFDQVFARVPRKEVFAQTGIQFMEINSLFQLYQMHLARSPILEAAEQLLMIPDLLHWFLSGVTSNEVTNATTTQFYNPLARGWAVPLLNQLGIPTKFLGPITMPGTRLGPLRKDVADETGLSNIGVVIPGTHDTASAVVAVPYEGEPTNSPTCCYISAGTWCLMGVEVPQPVISPRSLELNFTNEGGVGGTTRLLKNITGLWLLQECKRIWDKGGRAVSWDQVTDWSNRAAPLVSLVDPDHPDFQAPGDMPTLIQKFCERTNQPVPWDEGAIARCAVESIAMKCRAILDMLGELTSGRIDTVHMIGGGIQNSLLCQSVANACGRRVLAGPIEATALGNIVVQAISSGEIASVSQGRSLIRASFPLRQYDPEETARWQDAYQRFRGYL